MGLVFPEKFLAQIVKDETQDGNVIRIYCDDLIGEAKDKFLVIVSKSSCGTKFGCILINSDNYPNINNTHYLKSLQLPALASKYPDFLNDNSFFDCSDIKERKISDIADILKKDPKRMMGKVDIDDHKAICNALQTNRTLTPKIKKLYYLA